LKGGPVDLVFEGGGVKGIGLAGAFAVLDDGGWRPKRVAGTSAGAITAALVAAGYDAGTLEEIVLHRTRFTKFEDRHLVDRFGFPSEAIAVLADTGINKGKYFYGWIKGLLEDRDVRTFGDLLEDTDAAENDPARYKLQVIASDLTERRMLVLPQDARAHLGVGPDDLEVALAIRMSMSIPIFFDPVRWTNPETRHEHVIVDGGLLSNFPIWLFDCPPGQTPRWPTFGQLLVAPKQIDPLLPDLPEAQEDAERISSAIGLLMAIGETVMQAHDRLYVEQANYARTIAIPTEEVRTTDFKISAERAQALYDSGRDAAIQFLSSWNFAAYIAEFRQVKPQSRRADLVAKMSRGTDPGRGS
jgi:NTE family protein